MKHKRRDFLKKGVASAIGGAVAGTTLSSSSSEHNESPIRSVKPMGFQWETLDPFLFCAHHQDFYPKGTSELCPEAHYLEGRNLGSDFHIKDGFRMYHGKTVPGFPGHPHRGFETITVVRKGMVDHSDSMGASGRYGNGDVQWMTAGKGVQHAEMFPLVNQQQDNTLELFQLWLNLPAKHKMTQPHFKMFWKEHIPKIEQSDTQNRKTNIELIAGKFGDETSQSPPPSSWASDPKNEVLVMNVFLDQGASLSLPKASQTTNRAIYFYKGNTLQIGSETIKEYHWAALDASKEVSIQATDKKAQVLILQGKPIGEPVVKHGPFVMNSKEEIRKAFEDYQRTKFGGWPWERYDMVHAQNKGRFAKHADGRLEERG